MRSLDIESFQHEHYILDFFVHTLMTKHIDRKQYLVCRLPPSCIFRIDMGANQSKSEDEHVIYNDTPIQVCCRALFACDQC